MAGTAPGLAGEQDLAAQFGRLRLLGVQAAEDVQLRRWGEVEQLLHLGHEVNLGAAVQNVDSLLGGNHVVAVKVGRPLLELREVLDALEGPLRAKQPLDVDASQGRG